MLYTTNLNLKKPELTDYVDIRILNENADALDTAMQNKVDKVAGKQLSTEDYSTAEKTKLTNLPVTTYDRASSVLSGANVFSNIVITDGAVTATATRAMTKADLSLGSVENYGIATQAEAEAGTSDIKYMTPLRVKQGVSVFGGLKFATGSYSGNGATRNISCGFAPKQIKLFRDGSDDSMVTAYTHNTTSMQFYHSTGTSATFEANATDIVLTSTGFTVQSTLSASGYTYYWVATA